MRATTIPVLVLGVTAAVTLAAPAPAAAIPGLIVITEESVADSSATKSVTASCPAGTTVVGGGGFVADTYAEGEVFLLGMRPIVSPFGTGYQVMGTEDENGAAGTWDVVVRALCAPAPPGLEYRWATSAASSQSSRTVAATCSAGKQVIGTGATINGGTGQIGLRYIVPTPNPPTAVAVQAHEDETGYGGSWSLTSWAICANPLPGLERVTTTDGHTLSPYYSSTDCPGHKRVHGVGAQVTGDPAEVRLLGAAPNFPSGGGASANEDETGTDQRWSLTAIAICAY